jgi:hypothetical protein
MVMSGMGCTLGGVMAKQRRRSVAAPGAVGQGMMRRGGAGAGIHGGDDKEGKRRRAKSARRAWKRDRNDG